MRSQIVLAWMTLLLGGCASVRDANSRFVVDVETTWQLYEAMTVQDDLASSGYDAYIDERTDWPVSSKPLQMIVAADKGRTYPTSTRYHVMMGPYATREDAMKVSEILRREGFAPRVNRAR